MTAQAHEENGTGSDYAAEHLNGHYTEEEAQPEVQGPSAAALLCPDHRLGL